MVKSSLWNNGLFPCWHWRITEKKLGLGCFAIASIFLIFGKSAVSQESDPFYLNFARVRSQCLVRELPESQSQCMDQFQSTVLPMSLTTENCARMLSELMGDLEKYLKNGYQIRNSHLDKLKWNKKRPPFEWHYRKGKLKN